MNTILYFSTTGTVHETSAYSRTDVEELIRGRGLYCLTSADRQFDFWFSPSLRGCQGRTNLPGTELLLATTNFTAKTVPLLHGGVVVATHDADGDLDGLSWQQLDFLIEKYSSLTKRDENVLRRRRMRADRRRSAQPVHTRRASVTAATPGASVTAIGTLGVSVG